MDFFQIVVVIVFFILLLLIIKFVTKFLFKVVLFCLIISIGIFSYFHFSKKNIFDTMNELYCSEKKSPEDLKCKCFAKHIMYSFDLRSDNLTRSQVDSIKKNTFKSMMYFIESYEDSQESIRNCFEENGVSGGMAEEIKNDLIQKTTSFFDLKK